MSTVVESRDVRNCRTFSYAVSVMAALAGIFTLLGWIFGAVFLTRVLPGSAPMKPNTAVCFVLAGVSLWLIQLNKGERTSPRVHRTYIARVISGIVALIGALTLAEYLFHVDLGLDGILLSKTLLASGISHPGRMAGATALGFAILGSALLVTTFGRAYLGQSLALLITFDGFVACIGYLLGVQTLYDVPAYSSIAFHTALLFFLMGLAIIAVRPQAGLMVAVTSEYLGGVLVRRVLPLIFATVILLGWFRWQGQLAGLYGTEFGVALLMLGEMVIFVALVWISAWRLNQIDQQHRHAQDQRLRLAAIVESSNDAIFSKDLSGIINSWNHGAERLYGYRPAEIIGKPVATLIPDDLQPEASQFLLEIARGRLVTRSETLRKHKDGSLVSVSLVISPIRDLTGQIAGASSIAHDISERKRAEDELRASEDRYRDLVEHSQDLICTHDLSGKLLSANPAPARVLGYSVDEMLKIPMRDLIAPEFRQRFDQYLVRIQSHGADKGMMAVLTRSGERRIWEYHNTLRTEGVQTPVVRGMARDVTDKMRAAAALRESEQRYRKLFDENVAGVAIISLQGQVQDCNQAWAHMFGYGSAAELRGAQIAAYYVDPTDQEALLDESRKGGPFSSHEVQLRKKDGSLFWVLLNSAILSTGKDNPVIQSAMVDITERKLAEERLRQYERALEGMEEMVVVVDRDYHYVIANRAFLKYRGMENKQLVGRHIHDVLGREAFEKQVKPRLDQSFRGKVIHFEMKYTYPELGNRDLSISYFPIEENGSVDYVACVLHDVTDAKRAEETLREYARVVEGLEEMILVIGRDYRYVLANRAFLNFRGFSAEQVVGRHAEEVVGKDVFAAQVKEKMDACFLGQLVQYELTYDFQNRGKRDLWVSYFPIEGPTGIERIACVLQDITDRKLAEEALRNSEERFSKAFRNNPLAITISTEAEGRYLDVNSAFLDLLGYKRQEVIGRTSADLRFWTDPLDRVSFFEKLREKHQVVKYSARYRTAKDEIREAEIWAESIELEGKRCILAITRDVTEMQQLEAQYRQAQKMEAVGRLAGGIAHDFNNIIGIVMGYSDISLGLLTPDNPVNRYVAETKKAAQRAAVLTRQLLAFSRQQLVFPKILDLNDVVRNVTTMFLRLVGEDIEVEFRPGAQIGSIKADPGQIEQILMNLVVNARDAMPTGGKIIIETTVGEIDGYYVSQHPGAHAGKYVVLTVSDTGCGMDEATTSKIFEPFFTTKAVGKGTGLGLSTVYGIVKQSEGYILVYSEPGLGTTFKIYFPRIPEKATELAPSREEPPPPQGSETILLVEDDKVLRELTAKLLQEGGYRTVEANDAEEALKILTAAEPKINLLLTDVVMPGIGGVELVKRARVSHPNLPVMFMSGYASDLVALREALMQESSFLEKPFTKRSLLAKVYAILQSEFPNPH